MKANNFDSLYIICIEASIEELYKFSQEDMLIKSVQTQYQQLDIGKFYETELHEKSPLEFLGAIFFQPFGVSNKTVVLGNSGGWATLCNYICKNIGLRNTQFDMNSENSTIKRNSLFVHEKGNQIRAVQAIINDFNNWEFTSRGIIMPYENTNYYEKINIKERLNKEILIEYCIKYGLNILDDTFFNSNQKALYIKRNTTKQNTTTR